MAVLITPFQRPVGATVSDAELATFIPQAQQEAWRVRLPAEMKWLIASSMLDGNYNVVSDWAGRRVIVNPHDPKGSVKVKIPELLQRFRREKGRFLDLIHCPVTKPLVTGKPDIWRLNQFSTGTIAYLWQNTNFADTFNTFLSDMLMEGTAGLISYWDEDAYLEGETPGEVNFKAIPSWQLYPFPATAIDDASTDGIIWSRVVSEEWIKRNLPEAIAEATIQVASPYQAAYSPNNACIGYQLTYAFFKPSRRFPQGEVAIQVGTKVYRRMGQLPFWIGKRRVLPIQIGRYCKKNTSWWGESFGYAVSQMNSEINRMMTLMVRRAVVKAHPGYLLYPIGSFNAEDFKSQIGGFIPYRPSPLNPEATRPLWIGPTQSAPDSDVMINRLNGYMEDIASQHGPSMGETVNRVSANNALQSLIRQDMIPVQDTIISISGVLHRTFSIAIEIARQKWSSVKVATVSGVSGGPKVSVQIDPKNIPSLDEVTVVTGLDMPMDRYSQLQFMINLASPQNGSQPLLSPEELRRGMIAMGVSLPGVDLISPNEEEAWLENMTMYGDGIIPGMPPEPDPNLEDPAVHARVHRVFAASPIIRTASENVQNVFRAHIQRTGQLMSGSPLPEEFDSAPVQADSDYLSQQIAMQNTFGGVLK